MTKTCPHVGELPPEKFDCIDCEDNAKDCNCFACMGVFCNECNEVLDVDCEKVRQAYWRKQR